MYSKGTCAKIVSITHCTIIRLLLTNFSLLTNFLDVYFVEGNQVSDSYLTLTASVPTVPEYTSSDSVSFICKK